VTPPPNGSFKEHRDTFKEALQAIAAYPCKECKSTVPYFYCAACKAEWDKRQLEERDRINAKQRKWYARRKWRKSIRNYLKATLCAACGEKFEAKRKDAKFCSNTCRQKAYRARTQGLPMQP
jgi:hypothetical protein